MNRLAELLAARYESKKLREAKELSTLWVVHDPRGGDSALGDIMFGTSSARTLGNVIRGMGQPAWDRSNASFHDDFSSALRDATSRLERANGGTLPADAWSAGRSRGDFLL